MILTEIVISDSKFLLWFYTVSSTQPPFHIPTPASAHHYDLFMRTGWGGMGMLFCLSSYDVQIEGENFSDVGMWKGQNVEGRQGKLSKLIPDYSIDQYEEG